MASGRVLAVLCALAATTAVVAAQGGSIPYPYDGFIRVSGGSFVDASCREFLFTGWNAWSMLNYATNGKTPDSFPSGQAFIKELFRKAQETDMRVMRFFATGNDGPPLMTSPTTFDESVAVGLDFILDEAAKADIKLIIAATSLWLPSGVPQFEKWCGSDSSNFRPFPATDLRTEATLNASERVQTPYLWYTSPTCQDEFQSFLTTLATRKNTINGRVYKDDPVIFSWNLLNEPRCKYCGPEPINNWYAMMADHLKSVDNNHVITTGEEGFFKEGSAYADANPNDGNLWALRGGQDFEGNHASDSISAAVVHLWPDNWGNKDLAFGQRWLEAHSQAAAALGKPLIVEEFGKDAGPNNISTVRDPWYELIYNSVGASLDSGGPLKAALFWQWNGFSNGPTKVGSEVGTSDSTFTNSIEPFAHRVADQSDEQLHRGAASLVAGCTPVAADASAGTPRSVSLFEDNKPAAAGRKML